MPAETDISSRKTFSVAGRDPSREELALREVGVTDVKRSVAAALTLLFLLTLVFVPSLQLVHETLGRRDSAGGGRMPQFLEVFNIVLHALEAGIEASGSPWDRLMKANGAALQGITSFEDQLEDSSVFANAVLPPTQEILLRLGAGNEKVYVGSGGWLFYRPDVDYVMGSEFMGAPQTSAAHGSSADAERGSASAEGPVAGILDFQRQLASRGIELIVVPTPSKASIVPEKLVSHAEAGQLPLQNPSFARFLEVLEGAGVSGYDPALRLAHVEVELGEPGYLRTDTHWSPRAMDIVARDLAERVGSRIQAAETTNPRLRSEEVEVTALGDIATMLRLPSNQVILRPETISIGQILDDSGNLWRSSREAEVLLLGDSFSNIYSLGAMGWGESAGLAERLSFHLQAPLDAILRNDNGSFATREALARDLGRGVDRLAGKRIVIWQFAARELAFGNWKPISLELGTPPARTFVVPPEGEQWTVTGVVEEVSSVPRPGSVPYRDHVVSVHLTEVVRVDGEANGSDAVVYLTSMVDNVWTEAARLREGAVVRVNLRPWSEVAPDFERINRSELADVELQFEEPCWGELIHE